MPSAVSRLRSQLRQNGSVVDEMIPNIVPSGRRNRSAGADDRLDDRLDRSVVRGERGEHLRREITRAGDQRVAPPTSMYSMNRTSAFSGSPVLDQIDELVVVHALDDDRVDLEGAEDAVRRARSLP